MQQAQPMFNPWRCLPGRYRLIKRIPSRFTPEQGKISLPKLANHRLIQAIFRSRMNGQLAHLAFRALAKRIKHADAFNLIAKEIQPDRRGKRAGKNIQNTAAQGKFAKFPYRLGTHKAISGQKIANIILGDFLPCLYRHAIFDKKGQRRQFLQPAIHGGQYHSF